MSSLLHSNWPLAISILPSNVVNPLGQLYAETPTRHFQIDNICRLHPSVSPKENRCCPTVLSIYVHFLGLIAIRPISPQKD